MQSIFKDFRIHIPESALIKTEDIIDERQIIDKVKLPCFVNQLTEAVVLGLQKLKESELLPAINDAFNHGSEVVVEESIDGREVTCGVYRNEEGVKALPVTEIISENEYFDYDAKYNGKKSKEITPADLDEQVTNKIKDLTKEIYDILGMKGIVRMDYIINDGGVPFLIEINSVPVEQGEYCAADDKMLQTNLKSIFPKPFNIYNNQHKFKYKKLNC